MAIEANNEMDALFNDLDPYELETLLRIMNKLDPYEVDLVTVQPVYEVKEMDVITKLQAGAKRMNI